MTGAEIAVGYVFAWLVRKARRVAGRADAEFDQGLDAGMDRQEQADALYAVLAFGHLPAFTAYRRGHPHAEHRLQKAGLIRGGRFGDRIGVSDDVLFSLRYTEPEPGREFSKRWWTVTRPRPGHTSTARPPKTAYRRAIRWRDYATADWAVIDDYYGQHPRPTGRPH